MRELLLDGFQSPHGILSMYIEVLCGFTPTDARRFIEEEPDIDRKSTRLNSSHSGESRMPSSA